MYTDIYIYIHYTDLKAVDSLDCLDSLKTAAAFARGGADSTGRPHQKGLTWAAKKMLVCNFR